MAKASTQLELRPRTWGGKRPGAGRRPSGRKVGAPHRARPSHQARHPVHVTLRAVRAVASLRADTVFPAVRRALADASRDEFRVIEFSVQRDHIHIIAEAPDARGLSRGVQGLAIRIAKRVNSALQRGGAVWADRFHARALRTPREVRNALVYVLHNWCKHIRGAFGIDLRSSAVWFRGWRHPVRAADGNPAMVQSRTWHAEVGWRRLGLISADEKPAQVSVTGRRAPFRR